jgi:hypothetical protein
MKRVATFLCIILIGFGVLAGNAHAEEEYPVCNLIESGERAEVGKRPTTYTPFIEKILPGKVLFCWHDNTGAKRIISLSAEQVTYHFVQEGSVPTIVATFNGKIMGKPNWLTQAANNQTTEDPLSGLIVRISKKDMGLLGQ